MAGDDDDEQPPTDTQLVHRTQAWLAALDKLAPVLWIAAIWIPLQAVIPIARAFAGKHTEIAVTVSVSLAVTLSISGAYIALVRRAKAQTKEIARLRRRNAQLEERLITDRNS